METATATADLLPLSSQAMWAWSPSFYFTEERLTGLLVCNLGVQVKVTEEQQQKSPHLHSFSETTGKAKITQPTPPSLSHNSLILKPDIEMSPAVVGSENYLTVDCFLQ